MSREAFAKTLAQDADTPTAEPSRAQAREAPVQAVTNDTPSFTGEVGALFREGLKDLQNVVLHAFPDSVRGVEEPGTPLNPTQQMVTDAVRGGPEPAQGQATSLKDILEAPSTPVQAQEQERGGREM